MNTFRILNHRWYEINCLYVDKVLPIFINNIVIIFRQIWPFLPFGLSCFSHKSKKVQQESPSPF